MKTIVMQDALEIANAKENTCARETLVWKKLVRQETRVQFAMNQQMLANPMVIKGKEQQQQQQQERGKKGNLT